MGWINVTSADMDSLKKKTHGPDRQSFKEQNAGPLKYNASNGFLLVWRLWLPMIVRNGFGTRPIHHY
jgi:hypothetical protein